MSQSQVEINMPTHGVGENSVKINDTEVAHAITGFTMVAERDHAVQVILNAIPRTTVFSGMAEVAVVIEGRDALVQLLNEIDPKKLEAAALDGMGMGDGNLTEALLQVLKEMVNATQS